MDLSRPTIGVDLNETVDCSAEGPVAIQNSVFENNRFNFNGAYKPKEGIQVFSRWLRQRNRDNNILIWSGESLQNQVAWAKKLGLLNSAYVVSKDMPQPVRASAVSLEDMHYNRSGISRIKHPHLEQFGIDPKNFFWVEDRLTIGAKDGLYGDHEFFADNPELLSQYVGMGKLEQFTESVAATRARFADVSLPNGESIEASHMLPADDIMPFMERLNLAFSQFEAKQVSLATSVDTRVKSQMAIG